MKKYGLIGKKLSHTFSPSYFAEKFYKEEIKNVSYTAFELEKIENVCSLIDSGIDGFNVTIPYKTSIIPYLDKICGDAAAINAVNTVKQVDGKYIGYNSDTFGFETSLKEFIEGNGVNHAMVLGTGGASKAIAFVLNNMNISYDLVSRKEPYLTYANIDESTIENCDLIINTTPLGMFPNIDKCPDIPYQYLSSKHFLFDLVYNPKNSLFLKVGLKHNCKIKNGHDMLIYQAEKSWEIWNQL
jgi:shikimate dehydrogenase